MFCKDWRGFALVRSAVLLCFILTTFGGYRGVADGLVKRADDVDPWEQAVQQQAVVIQQQAAKLTALQHTVDILSARADKAVSFSVYSSKDPLTATDHGVFVFDVAVSNIGNGYDTQTGLFAAPYSGTYLFLVDILIPNNNNYIQVAIDKSGTLLALTHADSNNDSWDKGMGHVTVHLTSGDRVFVRHNAGLPELTGGMWTTFSGILIHAD